MVRENGETVLRFRMTIMENIAVAIVVVKFYSVSACSFRADTKLLHRFP